MYNVFRIDSKVFFRANLEGVLADRTNGHAYATVLRPSVVCNICIVAKRCVLPKNCLKKQMAGNGLWETRMVTWPMTSR